MASFGRGEDDASLLLLFEQLETPENMEGVETTVLEALSTKSPLVRTLLILCIQWCMKEDVDTNSWQYKFFTSKKVRIGFLGVFAELRLAMFYIKVQHINGLVRYFIMNIKDDPDTALLVFVVCTSPFVGFLEHGKSSMDPNVFAELINTLLSRMERNPDNLKSIQVKPELPKMLLCNAAGDALSYLVSTSMGVNAYPILSPFVKRIFDGSQLTDKELEHSIYILSSVCENPLFSDCFSYSQIAEVIKRKDLSSGCKIAFCEFAGLSSTFFDNLATDNSVEQIFITLLDFAQSEDFTVRNEALNTLTDIVHEYLPTFQQTLVHLTDLLSLAAIKSFRIAFANLQPDPTDIDSLFNLTSDLIKIKYSHKATEENLEQVDRILFPLVQQAISLGVSKSGAFECISEILEIFGNKFYAKSLEYTIEKAFEHLIEVDVSVIQVSSNDDTLNRDESSIDRAMDLIASAFEQSKKARELILSNSKWNLRQVLDKTKVIPTLRTASYVLLAAVTRIVGVEKLLHPNETIVAYVCDCLKSAFDEITAQQPYTRSLNNHLWHTMMLLRTVQHDLTEQEKKDIVDSIDFTVPMNEVMKGVKTQVSDFVIHSTLVTLLVELFFLFPKCISDIHLWEMLPSLLDGVAVMEDLDELYRVLLGILAMLQARSGTERSNILAEEGEEQLQEVLEISLEKLEMAGLDTQIIQEKYHRIMYRSVSAVSLWIE